MNFNKFLLISTILFIVFSLSLIFINFNELPSLFGRQAKAATETIGLVRQDCTGYSNCFTSLSAWEAAYGGITFGACPAGDLVCADKIAVAQIDGVWTNPDTIAVTIDGWTTDATHYIRIYTTTAARHRGINSSGYKLAPASDWQTLINFVEDYGRIEGLVFQLTQNNNTGINYTGSGELNIAGNIIYSTAPASNYDGIALTNIGINGKAKIWNNIIDYVYKGISSEWGPVSTIVVYNNTILNSVNKGISFDGNSYTAHIKNNLIQGTNTNYSILRGTGNTTSNNISQDATSPNIALRSKTVSFLDATNKDFHLSSSDTSAKDTGINLSADANLAFSDDIDGNTRPVGSAWDIGADEESTVLADTTPPILSNGAPTGALPSDTTQTTLSLSTNENSTCKYGTVPNTAYASITDTFTTTGGTSHSQTITGLTNGTSYNYYVRCSDSLSNVNTTDYTISFSVSAPTGDTTPPTVSITSPTSGAIVSGTITILANATDNVAVAGVQFKLDTNTNLGTEDTTSPYSYSLNTATITDGAHTLTAVARDTSNNYTTSSIITITINNASPPPPDITLPSIPISLTAAAISSSQINLSWTASTDNIGVTGYKIYRCAGSSCAPTVQIATSAVNSYSNTGLTASTAYTYAVSAYDAAGNESGKSGTASAATQASTGSTLPAWLAPNSPLALKLHPRLLFIPQSYRDANPNAVGITVQEMRDKLISHIDYKTDFQAFINTVDGVYDILPQAKSQLEVTSDAVNFAFLYMIDPLVMSQSPYNFIFGHTREEYANKAVEHARYIAQQAKAETDDSFGSWVENCTFNYGLSSTHFLDRQSHCDLLVN